MRHFAIILTNLELVLLRVFFLSKLFF